MTLDQIESLIAAVEHKNLRKAAEVLGVTQPTLSARIRVLEDRLGHRLLDRTPFGVELSEAGRRWLPYARTLLAVREQGRLALCMAPELKGQKFFGLHEYLVQSYTAPVMAALKSHWPMHAIHLSTQVSADLVERIIAGTLDAALIYEARPHRELEFHFVGEQSVTLFRTVDPKDEIPAYVEIDWGAEFPAFQQRFLSGRSPASMTFGSPAAAISYLKQNEGSAFLDTRDLVPPSDPLRMVRADYQEVFLRPVYLVHRRDEEFTELLTALKGTLLAETHTD